jgi:hypothetical protein
MEEPSTKPPSFSAIEPRAWTANRLYRVYVLPRELVCVWAGKGNDLSLSLAAQGGLIGGLLAAATSPGKKNASRKEELDTKPLAELRADHKHNFAVSVEDIDEAEIVPASFWFRMSYSAIAPVGLLRIRSSGRGRLTLALTTNDDMRQALEVLSRQLGGRLWVSLAWDDRRGRYVSCPPSRHFAGPPAEETAAAPGVPPAPSNIAAGPPSSHGPTPESLERARNVRPRSLFAEAPAVEPPRSSRAALVVGLVAGALLVVGAIALVWWLLKPAPVPDVAAPRFNEPGQPEFRAPGLPVAQEIPERWWRPFASAEGHFQIEFPGEVSLQEKDVAFVIGKVKRFAYSKVFPRPQVSFWADYMDITPEVARQCPPERCFQWAQDRMVAQLQGGKVVSERAIKLGNHPDRKLGNHPGRECVIVGGDKAVPGDIEIVARMYTVPAGPNTRLFLLMVRGINVRPAPRDVVQFFDSFTYKEP